MRKGFFNQAEGHDFFQPLALQRLRILVLDDSREYKFYLDPITKNKPVINFSYHKMKTDYSSRDCLTIRQLKM